MASKKVKLKEKKPENIGVLGKDPLAKDHVDQKVCNDLLSKLSKLEEYKIFSAPFVPTY